MYVSRLMWCCAALALSTLSSQGLAADVEAGKSERWLIAKYDVNGDQVISMDEVSEKREKMFGYMDGNADGTVTFDEYQHLDVSKRQLLLQARFSKLDLNRDGQLSADEYSSYLGSFERFDQNGDGQISSAEMGSKTKETAKDDDNSPLCLLWICVRSSID